MRDCSHRRFTHLKTLNGVQSVACFLWAAALLLLPFNRRSKGAVYAPVLSYWKASISNSIGPALGSEALKNISYPAQVSQPSRAGSGPPNPWQRRASACLHGVHGCSRLPPYSKAVACMC